MAVNPVSGQRLRHQHRGAQRESLRGRRRLRWPQRARPVQPEQRITVLDPATGSVAPRHLNKHIDYSTCCAPVPNAETRKSLALPTGMAVSSNGKKLYVAALGSDKIGVFNTAALEADTFVPRLARPDPGLAAAGRPAWCWTRARGQLYVLTRFDNAISIIDTRRQGRDRARAHVQPRAGERGPRPPLPLRRLVHLEPRRLGLRELPRLRRSRQPVVGPRRPRRGEQADARPVHPRSGDLRRVPPSSPR